MSEQESEAFQLAAELERTDSPLRRPDTVALRAAELLRQQWQDIQHAKVLLICEQHDEIERLRAENAMITLENARLMRQIYDGAIRARGER
jgi:hypothetical protein